MEHKTAAKKYSANELNYDTQLSGYAYAAAKMNWGEVGLRFQVTTKTKVIMYDGRMSGVRWDQGTVSVMYTAAVGKGGVVPKRATKARGIERTSSKQRVSHSFLRIPA